MERTMTMKASMMLPMVLCLLLLCPLIGCTDTNEPDESSIYYRPVPATVTSDIASALGKPGKANPISAEARKNVRTALAGIDAGDPWDKSKDQVKALRKAGDAAIPARCSASTPAPVARARPRN